MESVPDVESFRRVLPVGDGVPAATFHVHAAPESFVYPASAGDALIQRPVEMIALATNKLARLLDFMFVPSLFASPLAGGAEASFTKCVSLHVANCVYT